MPIGIPLEMSEDSKGLYTKTKLASTERGKEAYILLKEKIITEMSIGYETVKYEIEKEKQIRRLKEIKLWEYSLVTFAANDKATIARVKGMNDFLTSGSTLNVDAIRETINYLKALINFEDEEKPGESTSSYFQDSEQKIDDIEPELYHSILETLKKLKG